MLVRNPFTHDSRVEREATALARSGYSVTVVAEGRPELPREEEREGYRVLRVARGPARRVGVRMLEYRGRLIRALRRTEPEIIHAHDANALEPAAAVARRLRVPYIYDSHELWTELLNRGAPETYFRLARLYYRTVEAVFAPRAAAVITVSPPIAVELRRRYRLREVRLVPNYPELPARSAHRSLRDLAAAAGQPIPLDARIVLYVGNIQTGRGIDQLLRALALVPQSVGVFLGGIGPYQGGPEPPADVVALASELGLRERLRFLEPVPSSEVIDYAAGADLGVALMLPHSLSFQYSLPNKLFQYMAAGIPVVTSDTPHLREVVGSSGAGLLVDAGDHRAIARAIRTILEDRAASGGMGRYGRRAIEERYNWEVAARELTAIYAQVMRPLGRHASP
jgi:glycosyltransferase involved in cell wall biosynthesis